MAQKNREKDVRYVELQYVDTIGFDVLSKGLLSEIFQGLTDLYISGVL
jgi:hypothetical protein